MRTEKRYLVSTSTVIAIVCLSQACAPLIMPHAIKDVRRARSQSIEINTHPPGAHARAKCQPGEIAQAVERIAAQLAPQRSSAQASAEHQP